MGFRTQNALDRYFRATGNAYPSGRTVTTSEAAVLYRVAAITTDQNPHAGVTIPLDRLAAHAFVSRATAKRAVQKLEAEGLLHVARQHRRASTMQIVVPAHTVGEAEPEPVPRLAPAQTCESAPGRRKQKPAPATVETVTKPPIWTAAANANEFHSRISQGAAYVLDAPRGPGRQAAVDSVIEAVASDEWVNTQVDAAVRKHGVAGVTPSSVRAAVLMVLYQTVLQEQPQSLYPRLLRLLANNKPGDVAEAILLADQATGDPLAYMAAILRRRSRGALRSA